jgi:hypothetical protein
VNPNSATPAALKAVFRGAGTTLTTNSTSFNATVSNTNADALATATQTLFSDKDNRAASLGNATRQMLKNTGTEPKIGAFGTIKTEREAFARSMAGMTQTRTWNLLIDVIAQSGKYPKVAPVIDKFIVEGESRYWIHLALDRFTGEVVDIQYESVNE